jgi:acetyl-CoA acetyltransferase family protein
MRNGALSGLRSDDTLGILVSHLVNERLGIDPAMVEDLICGCATQIGEQGLNVARNALLAGGLPPSLPGVTVNRHEGSGLQAMAFAAQSVAAGGMDAVIACGVESMSRQPTGADGFGDHVAHLGTAVSPRLFERFGDILSQGTAAELTAESLGLTRGDLDAWAKRSYELAASAVSSGLYEAEIMTLRATAPDGREMLLREDEGAGRGITDEELASQAPAFKPGGVITAGNSGRDADAAAAVLVMAADKSSRLGIAPKARYVCTALSAWDPVSVLSGPITATSGALAKAGLGLDDIDLFEINECFASVILAWMRELAPSRPERVNAWGGAIANGNPLGAAGIKLACTLLSGLERVDGRYGLIATCAGMGMGIATILERIA